MAQHPPEGYDHVFHVAKTVADQLIEDLAQDPATGDDAAAIFAVVFLEGIQWGVRYLRKRPDQADALLAWLIKELEHTALDDDRHDGYMVHDVGLIEGTTWEAHG